jgi:hypothetical protein
MKRIEDLCRLGSIVCALVFVWAIAAEMDLLPALVESVWLRWQVALVAGLVLWVVAEGLADVRCRCCGSDRVLVRSLFTKSHEPLCRQCLAWRPSPAAVPTPEPVQHSPRDT